MQIGRKEMIVFLISFCVGLMAIALMEDKPEMIMRYPTPKNAGLVTYLDRASNCYEYESKKVECEGKDNVETIPIMKGEGFKNNASNEFNDNLLNRRIYQKGEQKWDSKYE